MSDECWPAPGTKPGTLHRLLSPRGNEWSLDWRGDGWWDTGKSSAAAADLADNGWRYVGPADD